MTVWINCDQMMMTRTNDQCGCPTELFRLSVGEIYTSWLPWAAFPAKCKHQSLTSLSIESDRAPHLDSWLRRSLQPNQMESRHSRSVNILCLKVQIHTAIIHFCISETWMCTIRFLSIHTHSIYCLAFATNWTFWFWYQEFFHIILLTQFLPINLLSIVSASLHCSAWF